MFNKFFLASIAIVAHALIYLCVIEAVKHFEIQHLELFTLGMNITLCITLFVSLYCVANRQNNTWRSPTVVSEERRAKRKAEGESGFWDLLTLFSDLAVHIILLPFRLIVKIISHIGSF